MTPVKTQGRGEINVGHGKFGKTNKCIKYLYPTEKIPKFNKHRAFDKAEIPEKKIKK